VPVDGVVRVEVAGRRGVHTGFLRDLSPGGMFVRLVDPEPPGARFRFTLRLTGSRRLVRGEAEVVWVRATYDWPGQPPGMAVRFVTLEERGRGELGRLLGEEPLAPAETEGGLLVDEVASAGPAADVAADVPEAPEGGAPPLVPMLSAQARVRSGRVPLAAAAAGALVLVLLSVSWVWRRASAAPAPGPGESGGSAAVAAAVRSPAPRPPPQAAIPVVPSGVPAPAEPAPEPAPPARGGAGRRLLDLRWEQHPTGTRLVARFDGAVAAERVRSSRIGGDSPRQVVQLRGIAGNPPGAPWEPATPELVRVRAGFHPSAEGGELHLVLDLADPAVRVASIEPAGEQLRIELVPR
jgi:uncharacterized protein (TIGR02266 family)